MGFNFGWLAVKGAPPERVMAALGYELTGRVISFHEEGVAGLMLPTGWYVIELERWGHVEPAKAAEISRAGGQIVIGYVSEMVMQAFVGLYEGGDEVFWIDHNAQQGIEHLETRGALPASFEPLRASMFEKQATAQGVDYIFSVPVEIAHGLTGYRYCDIYDDIATAPYDVLAPAGTSGEDAVATAVAEARHRWRMVAG